MHVKLPLMAADEMAEGVLVSGPRAGDQIAVHRSFLPANVSPGLGDPLTHVDAVGRGNRAPGVPAMPSPPRIVRRFPAAPATAPGASPQNRSRAKRHRIITIELGPAGVRVALLPDGSESGLCTIQQTGELFATATN